ncbi:MAG: hypothetical protein ABI740_07625 [Alphaproteobacteria bacterium]
MRAFLVASILTATIAAPASAEPPQPALVSVDGMGWLQVGMIEADLLRHFDPVDDHAKRNKWWKQCHFWRSESWSGLTALVEDGQLARLAIWQGKGAGAEQSLAVKTEEGIGLGASETDVRAAYSELRRDAAHPGDLYYQPRGLAGRGFRFAFEGGRVSGIYAGGPQIGYAENCE